MTSSEMRLRSIISLLDSGYWDPGRSKGGSAASRPQHSGALEFVWTIPVMPVFGEILTGNQAGAGKTVMM